MREGSLHLRRLRRLRVMREGSGELAGMAVPSIVLDAMATNRDDLAALVLSRPEWKHWAAELAVPGASERDGPGEVGTRA